MKRRITKRRVLASKRGDTSLSIAVKTIITVVLSGLVFLVITGIINNNYVSGMVNQNNDISQKDSVSDTLHESDFS